MGDGSKRSNTVRVSARDTVVDAGGGVSVTCPEKGTTSIRDVDEIRIGRTGPLATDGDSVWVVIDGRKAAELVDSATTQKLVGCLERGFRYEGTLAKRTVEFRLAR